ncbi:GDSL-type esterase/lipase family protein [Clostridium sp. Marseille-P299]|uniref:GDSL-type esterase/lipase family protein n=1 Tax=Clostridium sp. Marseille-P299 TaxID=1805477 RepID=UPI000830967C|nr:GDSL-type esterase/lipase family protein [Clostridium sp. Marseille-P299]
MVRDSQREKWRRRRRRRKIFHYTKIVVILLLICGIVYGSKKFYEKEFLENAKEEDAIETINPTDKPSNISISDDEEDENISEDTNRKNLDETNDSNPIKMPGESEADDGIKEPEVTKEPEAIKEPEATKEPEVTKEPEATKEPEVTKEPEATKEPVVTKEPEVTKTPEVTKKPEVTQKPEVTKIPDSNVDSNDDSYFDDAVFIGDSRTEGFGIYSGLKNATFYAEKGLMVDTILTEKVAKVDGEKMTILKALEKKSFKKVYIMLGVNELGWDSDSIFIERYTNIIKEIKELQPQAEIYVQSIIHINSEKLRNPQSYLNNKKINKRNELIKKMAEENEVHYLDLNSVLSDSNGNLFLDASSDGIHLNKEYCKVWKKYLIENK